MTERIAVPGAGDPALAGRWRAVDGVRGAVMIVMALDHLRDYLGNAHFDATDLSQTTAPLFLSRWITHFCAPTFFLLAGVSAFLSIRSGRRTVAEAARFLAVRGIVLVIVEQTLLRCFGWYFHVDYHFMNAGVLYGLGWSMVLLAVVVRFPPAISLILGLAIILGEAAIAAPSPGGPLGTLYALATKSQDFEPVAGYHFYVSYPPIPWFGAMAFGYGLAHVVTAGGGVRTRLLVALGAGFLALFALLRALGVGDAPWSAQPDPVFSILSFVNVSKYPPTTPYLLLTLGVALVGLAVFERWTRPGSRIAGLLETYGRVPLFFYLLHIPLIHAIAVIYSHLAFGAATWLVRGPVIFWDVALPGSPPTYGLPLVGVWLVWLAFIAALYPVCRWYAARARR